MQENNKSKKFLIIDANAVIHRAFHALPPLKTTKGEIVNAVYGFCLTLFKALSDFRPDFTAACFDVKAPTLRHQISDIYKAKREKAPDELYSQIEGVKKVLKAFGIPVFEKEGFEADDLIAELAIKVQTKQVKPKLETIILTGDNDALQLVNAETKVFFLRKGVKDIVLFGEKEVKEKYQGLLPHQLTDFRALRGDPSDNIPGVTGIGEKTAIELLNKFTSLENIYQSIEEKSQKLKEIKPAVLEKLIKYKEQAFLSKDLAAPNINSGISFSLEKLVFGSFKKEEVENILKEFEFFGLLNKIPFQDENQKKEGLPNQAGMFSVLKEENKTEREIEVMEKQGVFSNKVALLEKGLIPIIEQMEQNGIKVDVKGLTHLSNKLTQELAVLEKEIYQQAGREFNINSTQQLSEILFSELKISTDKIKKTPKGALSTNIKELVKLKGEHPLIDLLIKYRELFKLKTGFVDALPRVINPKTGRIHPKFHQLGTETGRMSCSSPNLQNIPIKGEMGKAIRKCFIADVGFLFVSADYSQMELKIAAHLSRDLKMTKAFKEGKDIHALTASEIFSKPQESITKEERNLAKTLNFGVLYGMGPVSFSQQTGLSRKMAKEFIEKYFTQFSKLKSFIEEQKKKALEEGFTETILGRKRFFLEINSRDQRIRSQAERMAVNLPLQGSAAEIMKMAMLKIAKQGVLDKNCKLLLQIHDELLFEVKKEKVKLVTPLIKELMENVLKMEFPLSVEVKTGLNWGALN
ncbi:MAG: DNA polymerase [bacterium]|nr:DNA polymerase [bacterium]